MIAWMRQVMDAGRESTPEKNHKTDRHWRVIISIISTCIFNIYVIDTLLCL